MTKFTYSVEFKAGGKREWKVLCQLESGKVETVGACATEENALKSAAHLIAIKNKYDGAGTAVFAGE
jgi:hypothetical protein